LDIQEFEVEYMSSRKYIQERRKKQKRQNTLLMLMMGGGVLLVFAAVIYAVLTSSRVNLSARQIKQPELTDLEQYDLSGLGDPDAPVLIEAYSDFSCSHCGDFALETAHILEDEYIESGQASMVFNAVGFLAEAPALQQAVEAAYCAGEQGEFWNFHDLIYANQVMLFTNRGADVSRTMESFAEILNLDLDEFGACVAEGKYQVLVEANQAEATQRGVTGTPTFFINGVKLVGNQPIENFRQAIEEALLIAD
jgi:protein-disulfide isomerase